MEIKTKKYPLTPSEVHEGWKNTEMHPQYATTVYSEACKGGLRNRGSRFLTVDASLNTKGMR